MSMLEYTADLVVTPNRNPHTIFQVFAPTNQRVEILGADVTLQGSSPATQPILFDWIIQTSAGTATDLTPRRRNRGDDEVVQATLLKTFTGLEPTNGSDPTIARFSVHQQGTLQWRPPFDFGPLVVKGGERVGLRYNSLTFVDVVLTIYLHE